MGDFLTAAYNVLKIESCPLTARAIVDLAKARGQLHTRGKTPSQTMKSKLSTDILTKKEHSQFMRTNKGLFALREWKERLDEMVADRYQKTLFDEDIVVIPSPIVLKELTRPGLHTKVDTEALRSHCFPMRRRIAEEDLTVIQLVSVFIIKYRGKILTHKRTKRLPESRLHGFYSIAFGGHLNPDDMAPLFNIFEPSQAQAFLVRELSEEVRLAPHAIKELRYRGLLYDDSRPVSKQHVGLVYDVIVNTATFRIGERGFLMDPKYESVKQIRARIDDFENWSELLIREEVDAQEARVKS